MVDKNAALILLAENPKARFWRVSFDQLTEPERIFKAIWELESEVNNGGFHQYFYNSSGDAAIFAPDALDRIGAGRTAAIVREALLVFPESRPAPDQAVRQEQLESLGGGPEELFGALDRRFFEYPDDLTSLLYDYVQTHRSEIAGA